MGRMGDKQQDFKSQLVNRICSISSASASASCVHRRRSLRKPVSVDWYLLLQVEEDAGMDVIRKRYRQLALQLHPDKNMHPKAEIAFKLVAEAYACLSDKAKRKAFNIERRYIFCKECSWQCPSETSDFAGVDAGNLKRSNTADQGKSNKVLKALKEVSNRFKEEAKVIENCLRVNAKSRGKESPPFDPSNYEMFPNYPHYRSRNFKKCNEIWNIRSPNFRKRTCESPIFEIRSDYQPIYTMPFTQYWSKER